MKKAGVILAWVALAGAAYWIWRQYRSNVGPVTPVIGSGDSLTADEKFLCDSAPLNSFGPNCRGYSWEDSIGGPLELRKRVINHPSQDAY